MGRRYSCHYEQCNCSFNTQAELNKHHKDHHPPVQCTVCKKFCVTPNTLDRHMYKHKERNMKCQYCKETFAFKSELEFHMANHQDEPTYNCKSCTKGFMRLSDLKEHEESHTDELLECPVQGCTYTAKLKRYIWIHLKTTHAKDDELPYPCKYCEQSFKFYEQRKRHYSNDHS